MDGRTERAACVDRRFMAENSVRGTEGPGASWSECLASESWSGGRRTTVSKLAGFKGRRVFVQLRGNFVVTHAVGTDLDPLWVRQVNGGVEILPPGHADGKQVEMPYIRGEVMETDGMFVVRVADAKGTKLDIFVPDDLIAFVTAPVVERVLLVGG